MNKEHIYKMNNGYVDLGSMKSKDLGNLLSKTLVEYGKELAVEASLDGQVDYGNLPSKMLPNLGKLAVEMKADDFSGPANENQLEQYKYNEFQPHNVKKEALGPNTRR